MVRMSRLNQFELLLKVKNFLTFVLAVLSAFAHCQDGCKQHPQKIILTNFSHKQHIEGHKLVMALSWLHTMATRAEHKYFLKTSSLSEQK